MVLLLRSMGVLYRKKIFDSRTAVCKGKGRIKLPKLAKRTPSQRKQKEAFLDCLDPCTLYMRCDKNRYLKAVKLLHIEIFTKRGKKSRSQKSAKVKTNQRTENFETGKVSQQVFCLFRFCSFLQLFFFVLSTRICVSI